MGLGISRTPCRAHKREPTEKAGALRKFNRLVPQAATLVGLTSRSLLELAIGIDRGFMASGISRTRSTCRSPFSGLARDPAILRQRGGEVDPIIGCSPETPARPTSRLARGNREGLFNPRWVLPIVEARPIFMEPRSSASRLSAADAFEG